MRKLFAVMIVALGTASALLAGNNAPEIDASTGAAAIALLAGGIVVLRARRKRQ